MMEESAPDDLLGQEDSSLVIVCVLHCPVVDGTRTEATSFLDCILLMGHPNWQTLYLGHIWLICMCQHAADKYLGVFCAKAHYS